MRPATVTKSGVMVGLGETMDELVEVFRDLGSRGVDILTVGQYLRPSRDHLPISRFYTPDEFEYLKAEALRFGFRHVESGPMVRSSYHAHEQAEATRTNVGARLSPELAVRQIHASDSKSEPNEARSPMPRAAVPTLARAGRSRLH